MATEFDIIVIGAGPGGYVAAIKAAQLGLKVAIVERDKIGGICLNWGCIPTKAMLRSAEVLRQMQRAKEFGLKADNIGYELGAVVARSRSVAGQLSSGINHLMKKNKISVIAGEATLVGQAQVSVKSTEGTQTVSAKNIIIATGARARELADLEADGELVWNYKHALQPKRTPEKLLVIGSGAIGVEFASFYNALGSAVTIVEVSERILPAEDDEISNLAKQQFVRQGMKILENAQVTQLERRNGYVQAHIKTSSGIVLHEFDTVISAVGIVGNVENLGLEALGVQVEKSHIVTDEFCRTGVDGVFAIGDVAGAPWLAHKASHEGVMVAEFIAGKQVHAIKRNQIAGCTYSTPQIASVGLSEAKARSLGYQLRVGRFPFIGNGKAIALGEAEGMVKTIFDAQTGELLGAHMIGPEVTELIQGYVIGSKLEATEAEWMDMVFPHPTLSEAMHESVLAAFGGAIHI
ncbi:dihydrolipoyl dehydrogenase [Brucella tritici]|uniref:Dihydrolipoyl dehydrogenase n=1 Tax=Brucella tritici TaxID=94626 RepID=A0A833CHV2_9HYPH|nr:dihydrolipoyl dehydrogenase [Brucella tritici]KAB2662292.1 dihydrolipoyl dehydrogenase [Brucella tritici]